MFRSVNKEQSHFTAIDESGRNVIIYDSISFLFQVEVLNPHTVVYKPVTFKNGDVLREVESYILGKEHDPEVISSIVVRFGWMDKRLNKLSFMNLTDVMVKRTDKNVNKTIKSKFVAICKYLSISMKNI